MIYTYDAQFGVLSRRDGVDGHGVMQETTWTCHMGREELPEVMEFVRMNPGATSDDVQRFAVTCLEARIDMLSDLLKARGNE